MTWMIISLCLSGCAGIPPYPSQLPALTPAEKEFGVSPLIAGRYADKGSAFSTNGKPLGEASLTQLLHNHTSRRDNGLSHADIVVVVGPENGVIEIQSWQAGAQIATMQRRQARIDRGEGAAIDTYIGNMGFAWLAVHSASSGAAGIGMFVEDESLLLRKAVDGSLIVLHHDLGFGILVIAPFWGRNDTWYRFPPIGDPTNIPAL